jgi:hypothetical protein
MEEEERALMGRLKAAKKACQNIRHGGNYGLLLQWLLVLRQPLFKLGEEEIKEKTPNREWP